MDDNDNNLDIGSDHENNTDERPSRKRQKTTTPSPPIAITSPAPFLPSHNPVSNDINTSTQGTQHPPLHAGPAPTPSTDDASPRRIGSTSPEASYQRLPLSVDTSGPPTIPLVLAHVNTTSNRPSPSSLDENVQNPFETMRRKPSSPPPAQTDNSADNTITGDSTHDAPPNETEPDASGAQQSPLTNTSEPTSGNPTVASHTVNEQSNSPENPVNEADVWQPPSGDTPQVICMHDWHQKFPQGNRAEFMLHWKRLTKEEKKVYEKRSRDVKKPAKRKAMA